MSVATPGATRPADRSVTRENLADGTSVVSCLLPLPAGWNRTETTVQFVLPPAFPSAQPDCFYTDTDLRLASGSQLGNSRRIAQLTEVAQRLSDALGQVFSQARDGGAGKLLDALGIRFRELPPVKQATVQPLRHRRQLQHLRFQRAATPSYGIGNHGRQRP